MYRWISIFLLITVYVTGCMVEKEPASLRQERKIESKKEVQDENLRDNNTAENAEKFRHITEIKIIFHEDHPFWNDTIIITDRKIISDIMSMIETEKNPFDESEVSKIREAAKLDNQLTITQSDGLKEDIIFVFDDLYETGYIEREGKKYKPDYSFFRYLQDLSEYTDIDTSIDEEVYQLFNQYKWTVDYKISTLKEQLPKDLTHKAGEYPIKLYWAYSRELSRETGLDFIPYLGKDVTAEIYRLREPLPEFMYPRQNARGIVLKDQDEIIGAYIDAGRHDVVICSLSRKSLEDVTGKNWGKWLEDHIDDKDELEMKLARMTPEELIRTYYEALNKNDITTVRACMTRENLLHQLSANLSNTTLYNRERQQEENNIKKAKLLSIETLENMENEEDVIEYAAEIEFDFKKEITSEDGVCLRFIRLKKESEKLGYRIESIGAGP